ncbi:MAG: hypothetical protein OJF49_003384 [Ktedonobacterales bacterium]|jgi:PBSX family phage terminase large subunit|nr:MAG: hypothetical protein OJF49_003384 [Ktedonobacterales bacterium]
MDDHRNFADQPSAHDGDDSSHASRGGVNLNHVQWAFVHSRARFSFYVGGAGAGKTFAGALRAVNYARQHPGSLGLVGAPTYPMLHDAAERAIFDLLSPAEIRAYSKTQGHLILTNGSEVLFRSLDEPDRARGLNLAWFWLDEAPYCGYYAWKILKGRLRQRGYPTAAWATGTPNGRDGYWREFERDRRPSHALYRAATFVNQRHLPANYIDELEYTGVFAAQEILGQFVSLAGLVYAFDVGPGGNIATPPENKIWSDVVGGIDWGYTNPAAALVFGLDGDDRAWQLDEYYQRRASLQEALIPAILDLTRRYRVRRWYCGPDEPEHIAALAQALAHAGLPSQALRANNAVRAGIQTLTSLLACRTDGTRGLHVAPRCVNTITEYGSYQYTSLQSDQRDSSELPLKRNDHALDATRYALHTALGQSRATTAYLDTLQRRVDRQLDRRIIDTTLTE